MKVELKALIAKLNPVCRKALEAGAELCVRQTNYDVEVEHLLRALLGEDPAEEAVAGRGVRARVGEVDVAKIRDLLKKEKFNTVLGEVGFDAKGDVTAPGYVFYEWKDGKAVKPDADGDVPADLEDRLILPMVNESVAVWRDAVVDDLETIVDVQVDARDRLRLEAAEGEHQLVAARLQRGDGYPAAGPDGRAPARR